MRSEALTRIESSAEKWAGTVGTLLGLFSVAVVIKGPDDISKVEGHVLGLSWQVAVGLLLLVALALATISVYSAAIASQGTIVTIVPTADAAEEAHHKATVAAAALLKRSRKTALWTLPFIAAAVAVVWYQTPDDPEGSKVMVVDDAGEVTCGTLSKADNAVRIDVGTRDVDIDLTDIKSIQAADACP